MGLYQVDLYAQPPEQKKEINLLVIFPNMMYMNFSETKLSKFKNKNKFNKQYNTLNQRTWRWTELTLQLLNMSMPL